MDDFPYHKECIEWDEKSIFHIIKMDYVLGYRVYGQNIA